MANKELPAVPFERKTKKWGMVTVLEIMPTDAGGLIRVAEGDHMEFWARAKDVLGEPIYK
jgi:hypothetical protein